MDGDGQAPLLTAEEGGILIATLNRPEKLNPLSVDTMALLGQALLRFREDAALKVMLIQATGRYFSAGADMKERSAPQGLRSGSAIRAMHRLKPDNMRATYDLMESIEKPIVVAHHATCVGGGLELSLSCDFRLAAESASYALPEGKMGILPATNGTATLTRLVGPHWARLLIMANLPVSAHEAWNMGLVHKVFPDASFRDDVMAFCRHLAKQNAEQMGTAKLAIELCSDLESTQARSVERLANSALMLMPDYQEHLESHTATIGKGKGA